MVELVYLVAAADGAHRLQIAELSRHLDVLVTELSEVPRGALTLVAAASGLELRPCPLAHGLRVEFTAGRLQARRGHLSRSQPLVRALGRDPRSVLDATAGWGQDAFLLACLGYSVVSLERSRVVHALLEDGRSRALEDPRLATIVGERLRFEHGDARAWIEQSQSSVDAIYLDPMFPPKRKRSALPSKEVQLLRRLVGDDPDSVQLAGLARARCEDRLVVKRPHHAAPLLPAPTVTYSGKLVRYDVYRRFRQSPSSPESGAICEPTERESQP
ncbi:MAG: class I SAM-dependent methyltransferase [Planctomycetota bacterium]